MALAGSLKANLGVATGRTETTGGATALMAFLPPSNSDLSLVLNSSRGRPRKSAATRTSGSTLASSFAGFPSVLASSASTARFNCSIFFAWLFRGRFLPLPRERLGIGTLHARPQAAEGAELQLLHCAFRLANLPRHFLNAFLLHEPQHHDPPLLRRQTIDEAKQASPPLHFFEIHARSWREFDVFQFVRHLLPAPALPPVRNQIRGNPVEPCRKRNPPPFKSPQVGQRMMKYLGGQVLGFRAVPHPPHHVRIDPFKVALV